MTPEERITDLETAFVTITRLAQDFNDRLLTHDGWINRLGEAQAKLSEAQAITEIKMAALTEAQANTDVKIAALTDGHIRLEAVHIRLEEAHIRLEEAQAKAAAKIAALAESQAHSDQKLNALIDIIRDQRNGEA